MSHKTQPEIRRQATADRSESGDQASAVDRFIKGRKMRTRWFLICLMLATTCFGAVAAPSQEGDNRVPQDVFNGMRESFRADQARGVHLRYQWELSGPNGGQWWIEVNDGRYKMEHGQISNPDVTFVASDKTWVDISNGKLKGSWAVMTGRLKVRGSKSAARKLDDIFP
jgi:putative sterol carrier protein